MPTIEKIPRATIEREKALLSLLELNLGECLCNQIEEEYIYKLDVMYATDYGPAMIAVARLVDGRYGVFSPEYLAEEQLQIFEFFIKGMNKNDHVLVFSHRDYTAIKKYLHDSNVDISIFY